MRRPVRPEWSVYGKGYEQYKLDLREWEWYTAMTWATRVMWGVFVLMLMFTNLVPSTTQAKHIINDPHHYSQAPK